MCVMGSLNLDNNISVSEPKILLVGDGPGEIKELVPKLDVCAELIQAQFGTDALRKLMKYEFALIIFDISSSFQLGSELIQWIKQEEKSRSIPVVVLADDTEAVFSSLQQFNIDAVDCISRPINSQSFRGKINQYLQLFTGVVPEVEAPVPSVNFNGSEILLVEDNQTNRMIAEMMLEALGCNVTMAEDGEEAIALLEKQVFQLIFMDCHMPKMDGYEAARFLKDRMGQGDLNACPIIAFTANERKEDRKKCARAGMNDYISKPVSEDALIAVLSKWVA